jgi:Na+/alanine symporter
VWPLVLSLIFGNIGATLWIYGIAIFADSTLFVLWLVLAMRYSQRAARGELFSVPLAARITGTTLPK